MGWDGVKNLASRGKVLVLFLSIRMEGLEVEWRGGEEEEWRKSRRGEGEDTVLLSWGLLKKEERMKRKGYIINLVWLEEGNDDLLYFYKYANLS